MQSNPEIEKAWRIINNTNKSLFLTGKAGTGKTTFLKRVCHTCAKRVVVTAPTGVAAINADGVTLHSLFQLPFSPYIPGTLFSKFEIQKFSKSKIKLLRAIDLLIIDEISMVRADVLDAIDTVLRRYRHRNAPFGGVQLLMIGDLQQLSPVATSEVWKILQNYYQTPYFFSSKVLEEVQFTTIELREIYRQTDQKFLNLLNQVRNNQLTESELNEINKRYIPGFKPNANDRYVHLTTHNHQAQIINQHELASINKPEFKYWAKVKGEFPENIYPTEDELVLKLGAQVMFVKNDLSKEKLFYNGMIGEIVEIDTSSIKVKSVENDNIIDVEPMTWVNSRYIYDEKDNEIREKELGTFTQYPIKTAWAITIHKSQGLTFSHAIIDAQDSFAHGQVYVALSRCKTLEGLVLSTPLHHSSIVTDHQITFFNENSVKNMPNEVDLDAWEKEFYLLKLGELYDFTEIQHGLARLLNYLQENFSTIVPTLIISYRNHIIHFYDEVINVAERFAKQYSHILYQVADPKDNLLQERFAKACNYFIDHLIPIKKLIESTEIPTDSQESKKYLSNKISELKTALLLKQKILAYILQNGFDPIEYTRHFVVFSMNEQLALEEDNKNVDRKTDKKRQRTFNQNLEISSDIQHPELYHQLITWRAEKAKILAKPAYIILQQKAILGISALLPRTSEELLGTPYVGKVTVDNYGLELLKIVINYCNEKGISTKELVFEKLKRKEHQLPKIPTSELTWQLYQDYNSVDKVAELRNLTKSTIFKHLMKYVDSGQLMLSDLVPMSRVVAVRMVYDKLIATLTETPSQSYVLAQLKLDASLSDYCYTELQIILEHYFTTGLCESSTTTI